jgi:uncharacterized membrane protein
VIAVNIGLAVLSIVLAMVNLGVVAGLLWMVLPLAYFVGLIVLMIKAYQGQMWRLPIIGDLAAKQAGV